MQDVSVGMYGFLKDKVCVPVQRWASAENFRGLFAHKFPVIVHTVFTAAAGDIHVASTHVARTAHLRKEGLSKATRRRESDAVCHARRAASTAHGEATSAACLHSSGRTRGSSAAV